MTFSTSSMVDGLGVDVVGHDLAPAQHHDAIHHLEDVVDVVGDEDAGVAGVAGVADEAQDTLRLGHAEVVGGLVEDDELAVEVHGAGDGDCLALATRERVDGRLGRDVLGDADLAQQLARRPRSISCLSMRLKMRGPLSGSRPRKRLRAIDSCVTSAESW